MCGKRNSELLATVLKRAASAGMACAALLLATPGAARGESSEAEVDLTGTWFILIHYTDSATANPDAERWEDKVWTFEKKGSRLHWTEYPIVVFENQTGRFETLGRNTRARALRFWEPNQSQRERIAEGPRVNTRGSKSKSLRGSVDKGYESVGQMRAVSASVIGYHETWSIEAAGVMPVFTRDDVLGSGRSEKLGGSTENVEGRTSYTTLEFADGGNTLRGRYQRDLNRVGVFRMIRAGPVQGLELDDRTPNEKEADQLREAIEREREQEMERGKEDLERRLQEGDPEAVGEARRLYREKQERRPGSR
jgi:hypothetical protein